MAGKRITAARAAVEGKENLKVADAIALVKSTASAKFDEPVEIALNLGVDPRHADQMVRGTVNLPNGTGKTVRVAVFARGDKAEEAKAAGADIVGAEDLMEIVQGGKIEFERCIATPDMMPIVGRLGKVLGPRNLMPNPKIGTVTMDVAEAVKAAKGVALITADHGNADEMFEVDKAGTPKLDSNGKAKPKTSHTLNLVPCYMFNGSEQENLGLGNGEYGLSNIAATVAELKGFKSHESWDESMLVVK